MEIAVEFQLRQGCAHIQRFELVFFHARRLVKVADCTWLSLGNSCRAEFGFVVPVTVTDDRVGSGDTKASSCYLSGVQTILSPKVAGLVSFSSTGSFQAHLALLMRKKDDSLERRIDV